MDSQLRKRGRKGLGTILGKVTQNAFCMLRKEADQEASRGEEKDLLLIVKLDRVSPTSARPSFLVLASPSSFTCNLPNQGRLQRPGREALYLPCEPKREALLSKLIVKGKSLWM